jgi:hypothetical protein
MTLEAKWFSLVFSWRQTNAKATHEENWKSESDVIKKKMDIFFFFLLNDNRWTCLVVY